MNDVLAVYRGPLKNRYGFIRGASYRLNTQRFVRNGLGMTMVLPFTLSGEIICGPLYYWNKEDLGFNWIPLEYYNEYYEKEIEEETRRMKEEHDTRIIFKFKEEK